MRGARAAAIAVAAAMAMALPGCLDPYRVHVDPDVRERLLHWDEDSFQVESRGGLSPRYQETRYTFDPSGQSSYPGVVQVFSVRSWAGTGTDGLMRLAQDIVDEAVEREHVALDPSAGLHGSRETASGVATQFFVREGSVRQRGTLFDDDVKVRILGEVGEDGRSRTGFLVVALAQTESKPECPPLVPCTASENLRTWIEVAGDPDGSVAGATLRDGLVHNLVTH